MVLYYICIADEFAVLWHITLYHIMLCYSIIIVMASGSTRVFRPRPTANLRATNTDNDDTSGMLILLRRRLLLLLLIIIIIVIVVIITVLSLWIPEGLTQT